MPPTKRPKIGLIPPCMGAVCSVIIEIDHKGHYNVIIADILHIRYTWDHNL